MNYKFLLWEDSNRGVGVELLGMTDSIDLVNRVRSTIGSENQNRPIIKPPAGRKGAKGKKVYVKGVEDENTTSLRPGDILESANELSALLGFGYNAVSGELRKADLKGEKSTVIRGVEVCFLDDVEGRV